MKRTETKGIVLRRQDYGEADRILTLLTEDGYLSAYARGVRKLKSKLAGGIELFSVIELSLIEGKSELMTVGSARSVATFNKVIQDYELLQRGYDVLKVAYTLRESNDVGIYSIVVNTLNGYDTSSTPEVVESWFILQVLNYLGHEPNLILDSNEQPLEEEASYHLDPSSGSLVKSPNGIVNGDIIKFWRLALASKLTVVVNVKGGDKLAYNSLPPLREFLNYYIS